MRHRFIPRLAALTVVISAVVVSDSAFAEDTPKSNQFWWPELVDLSPLRDQNPAYLKISERFLKNPKDFELAFAKAWFKLTHRDMGRRARYVGDELPAEAMTWQGPIPEVAHPLIGDRDIEKLKAQIIDSGLIPSELVRTAWAPARLTPGWAPSGARAGRGNQGTQAGCYSAMME